jgi:putative transposase
MDKTMDRHLVINALLMAVWQRNSKNEVLVHSDQDSQYASSDYLVFMNEHKLIPSMSRRVNCHGNAFAESFFATFKKRVTKRKIYSIREEAKGEEILRPSCIQSSRAILLPRACSSAIDEFAGYRRSLL